MQVPTPMTSRERFRQAMAHRTPDRVPFDLGGTCLTGMRPECQARLLEFLGLKPAGKSGSGVDESILKWAGTDFRFVGDVANLPSPHTKTLSPTAHVNCWGTRYDFLDGDWQITGYPLKDATLDDLKAFPWPEPVVDEKTLAAWTETAKALRKQDRHVVVASHPVYGILELGCWMCGYDDFLLKFALDPDFVKFFFDKFFEIQTKVNEQYYAALGPYIDLTISGDDFGSQNGPLISPAMFEEFISPYFSERIKQVKTLAGCYYWHHSCGSIFELLDPILACGVDILNPIQTSAFHMEPERLKAAYGDRLVFWGAVDVQQFLPLATPAEIPDRIRELLAVLGKDGGYVMAPAHEIQRDIPPENLVAWVETVTASGHDRAASRPG